MLRKEKLKLKQKTKPYTRSIIILISILCLSCCKKTTKSTTTIVSDNLQITEINEHSYIHVSLITLDNGQQFSCNGFIYVNNDEAYVFDTPATIQGTTELIDWLQNNMKTTIKGVVFNHSHDDCTKGIDVFKNKGIPTIASKKTAELMINNGISAPDHVFNTQLKLSLGNKNIINSFIGEAHTPDNIVSYFCDEKMLFGGCMIKSMNATKGNLADANIAQWPKTIKKIKETYPDIKIAIPGHGDYGDLNLLEYTIALFTTEN